MEKQKKQERLHTDPSREKFVEEFNKNKINIDGLEELSLSSDLVEKEQYEFEGGNVDRYVLKGIEFSALLSRPSLEGTNALDRGRRDFLESVDLVESSKMALNEVRDSFGYGNNYISCSLINEELYGSYIAATSYHDMNTGRQTWSYGYSYIDPEDIIVSSHTDAATGHRDRLTEPNVKGATIAKVRFSDAKSSQYLNRRTGASYNEVAIFRYYDEENTKPRVPDFIWGEPTEENISIAGKFGVLLLSLDVEAYKNRQIRNIEEVLERYENGEAEATEVLDRVSVLEWGTSTDILFSGSELGDRVRGAYDDRMDQVTDLIKNIYKNEMHKIKTSNDLCQFYELLLQSYNSRFLTSLHDYSDSLRGLSMLRYDGEVRDSRNVVIGYNNHKISLNRALFEAQRDGI